MFRESVRNDSYFRTLNRVIYGLSAPIRKLELSE